ncbi:sigma-54 interaction domain-containing protein [Tepidibacter formicigenes]|uniref:Transcriptional regulator containing PAS, AAA-type ATPase, and DNA-binding Fis domains n=1 Tax=Tepidibacter formicigenes DSM 15518 TaxID=1123349 RepID=A0A1M6NB57_9FIRM|nr:sigma 54-interacting transcriptional regulator [Tepidibacter formicigenes]SHJ92887.1 Transcriptional regulator containing PAS, AAA-type ATPase, and DNA-binding Fis domains [Tepidibacter formicigenes DSM 15518]
MNECNKMCMSMESIVNSIPFGILAISLNGNINLINNTAREMLELEDCSLESIDLNDILPNWKEIIEKAKKNNISFEENILINRTKHRLNLEINSMKKDEEFIGLVVIIRDIKKVINIVNKYSLSEAIYTFDNIVYKSQQMKKVIQHSKEIANSPSTVLITGQSGSGKELLAQAIHNSSNRKKGPFIAVNCGAIPKNLIESELFGYEDGSFTGAKKGGRAGKFELADGGTIFLDEIGEMPLEMQVTLLRVLQENCITRIGGKKSIPINVRIIAATNKDLKKEIKKGTFREDLFYRLSVIPIKIPPLKDRIGDVPVLIDYFLNIKSNKLKKEIPNISDSLYKKMISYCWPGNVRELENCVENIVNLNGKTTFEIDFDECTCMTRDNLGNLIKPKTTTSSHSYNTFNENEEVIPLKELEKNAIIKSISLCKGNMSKAALKLGISRNTLYNKIKKYNIQVN